MLIIIASISFITASLLLAFLLFNKTKKKTYSLERRQKKNSKKTLLKNSDIYRILSSRKTGKFLLLYIEEKENSNRLSRAATKANLSILLKSLGIFFVSALILLPLASNLHILIGSIIALSFIFANSVDFFISRERTKLLEDFVYFLEVFRTKYFESSLKLDSSLFETLQSLNEDRYARLIEEVEYILAIVESPSSELDLRDYYQIAPNSYFKIFAGLLAINKENGDVQGKDGSGFAKALSELSGEIKDEIILRDKLNYSLRSLNIIALLPLFTLDPIKNWASSNFYPLQKFFSSKLGINTEIILILVILSANYFLSKLKAFDIEARQLKENRLYDRLPSILKKIVDLILPYQGSKRYQLKEKNMRRAMDYSSMKVFYSKKVLSFLCVFLLFISISVYANYLTRRAILDEPTAPKGYMGGELSGRELEKARELSQKDKQIIVALLHSNNTKEESEAILAQIEDSYGVDKEGREEVLTRIIDKAKAYRASSVSVNTILISYLLALIAFQLPDLGLLSRAKLLKLDSISEVSKFQLIILLLMHIKQVELSGILEWMEMFALVYKRPIQEAILDYDSGSETALRLLKEKVDDEEFKKLIEHMMSAEATLSIELAFQDLENEKKYYEMKRKTLYERIVARKSSYGRSVGFIPIYAVILLYFMFPLIYSGYSEINNYFSLLS